MEKKRKIGLWEIIIGSSPVWFFGLVALEAGQLFQKEDITKELLEQCSQGGQIATINREDGPGQLYGVHHSTLKSTAEGNMVVFLEKSDTMKTSGTAPITHEQGLFATYVLASGQGELIMSTAANSLEVGVTNSPAETHGKRRLTFSAKCK